MSSKSSRSLNKRRNSLGLGTPKNRSRARVAPTHKKKDREKMRNLTETIPSHNKRRTMGRRRNIPRSGATSIRSLGITLLIVAQRSHWWLR
jgi:hypothetical protein